MFILFSHIMCSLKCHQDTKSDCFLIETQWGFFAFVRKQDKLSVKLMVMNPYTVDALCSPFPHLKIKKILIKTIVMVPHFLKMHEGSVVVRSVGGGQSVLQSKRPGCVRPGSSVKGNVTSGDSTSLFVLPRNG